MSATDDLAALAHTGAVPDLLTPREAMTVLRIGRTTLYEEARRYTESGGTNGIPNVQVGKQRRFTRVALEEMIGCPITWPPLAANTTAADQSPDTPAPRARSQRTRRPPDSPRLVRV